MKKLKILALVVLISAFSFAQSVSSTITNTIHFSADIIDLIGVGFENAFDPTQDSLLVMGFDTSGCIIYSGSRKLENWDPFYPGLFSTTLVVQSNIDSVSWKFKAFPDSRFKNEGWEFISNRVYTFSSTGTTVNLPTILPRIIPNLIPIPSVDFTINVDMAEAINRYNGLEIPSDEIEFIGIRGRADFLGSLWDGCWCPDDTLMGIMKVLTYDTLNIWKYQVDIPAGHNGGYFTYKFAAMYPGSDTINGGVYPLDNEFPMYQLHTLLIDGTHPIVVLHKEFGITSPDNVEKIEDFVPTGFNLEQNYPNPFNPATKIRYSIPETEFVSLKIFNLLGQEIEVLVNQEQTTGVYEATFDASRLSSGIYFYTLSTKNYSITKKMLLVR